MKKYIYIVLLFCGLMTLSTSCEDGDTKFNNDEYSTILYLGNSGEIIIDFYNLNTDFVYTTSIRKGGTSPEGTATALLRILEQEEMDIYNREHGTTFQILPKEYYTMPTDFSFDAEDGSQVVNITFKKEIGFDLDTEANQYVLPIRLYSDSNNVNPDLETLVLRPNVITPYLSLGKTGIQKKISALKNEEITGAVVKIPVALNTENVNWTFKALLETDGDILQELVNQYKIESGTFVDYKLLPEGNYTFESAIQFTEGEKEKEITVNIRRKAELSQGEYLLPVVLKGCDGMPFKTVSTACLIHVEVVGEVVKVDLRDKVSAISEASGDNIGKAIDGEEATLWQSVWYVSDPKNNPVGKFFDSTYGVYIDIKGLNIKEILQFNMVNKDVPRISPKSMAIYVGTSESNLTKVWETDDAFPNPVDKRAVCDTGFITSGEITMVRIACLSNGSGKSMTALQYYSNNYLHNVCMNEIELFGY